MGTKEEGKENFPGEGRLSKDLLVPVAMGLRIHSRVHTASWRERWRKARLREQMAETPSPSQWWRETAQTNAFKVLNLWVLLRVQEITGYKSARIISAHANSMPGHSGSGNILFFLCNDFWCYGFRWIRPFRGKTGILIYKIVKCQIKSLNNVCV